MTVLAPPPQTPIRTITLLAVSSFATQAMVRVTDSLLPQIAADFSVTVGAAAIVVTAYAVMHGTTQLVIGPIGDKFGKYRTVTFAVAAASVLVFLCGMAGSLDMLALARLASGAFAGWIIPLGMAYVGDVTPYEKRQQVLGTYLSGQIMGQLFGQAMGGVLGDLIGWRGVFFLLAGIFAVSAVALLYELRTNPVTRWGQNADRGGRSFMADYSVVLQDPWARLICIFAFLESMAMWGPFAFVGADLHLRFGLSYTMVGLIVGMFAVGGLIYSTSVRVFVGRLGQTGLAIAGGATLAAAYVVLAVQPVWWASPVAVCGVGLGFYMLHNTLQTNATQMTPHARGTAVAIFSSALYLGQTAGVAGASLVVDRWGAAPIFVTAAVALLGMGFWFAHLLRQHRAAHGA
ncbi:MAG: MFS transporter [Rhizobiales bacterium]|nr:MFS transporter [Hyphomicrobiales bacterium]